MAIFQPTFITPDVRGALGNGVIDATEGITVSWQVNGPSPMLAYYITFYLEDGTTAGTVQKTLPTPFYGTDSTGAQQRFVADTITSSYLSGLGITNGTTGSFAITQWWDTNATIDEGAVVQSSRSVFYARSAPTLSIDTIGTSGVISGKDYTFTASYTQAEGDVLNFARWRIAPANDLTNLLYDSGNVYGTMDLTCSYDGFFTDTAYAVRLNVQTQYGVNADTGWVNFSADYETPETTGEIIATCVPNANAVKLSWQNGDYVEGQIVSSSGGTATAENGELTISTNAHVLWGMSQFPVTSVSTPWSVAGRVRYGSNSFGTNKIVAVSATVNYWFELYYKHDIGTISVAINSSTLQDLFNIFTGTTVTGSTLNEVTISYVITNTALYLKPRFLLKNGTYVDGQSFTQSLSYTQGTIASVELGGGGTYSYTEIVSKTLTASDAAALLAYPYQLPSITSDTKFMTSFWTGAYATSYELGGSGDALGMVIYRKKDGDSVLVKVAEVTGNSFNQLYDYAVQSRQGPYIYYAFPIGSSGFGAVTVTDPVNPCFNSWSLIECKQNSDGSYSVLSEYRFKTNLSTGAISNNNRPNIENNFTRYPTFMRAPQNYKSGSLSALIGVVNYGVYSDTISMRDRLFALSTTENTLFLKSRKGDFIKVRVSEAISFKTMDNTYPLAQSMSLSWVEVGPAAGTNIMLTAEENEESPETLLSPNLTVTPSTVNITTGETAYLTVTYLGNGALEAHSSNIAGVGVNGTLKIVSVYSNYPTTESVTISVSESGRYAAESLEIPVVITAASKNLTYGGTTTTLSVARSLMGAASVGSYAIFAGGQADSGASATVDAYDNSLTHIVANEALSENRYSFASATVENSLGGKYAVFAGGYNPQGSGASKTVDAYDESMTRHAVTSLDIKKYEHGGSSVGLSNNKYALFCGGYNGTIQDGADAYDSNLTHITATALASARRGICGGAVGNYALMAGGKTSSGYSSVVEAYDQNLTRSTITSLNVARGNIVYATAGATSMSGITLAIFAGGSISSTSGTTAVDAYESGLTRLPLTALGNAKYYHAGTTLGGIAVFVGGTNNNVATATADAYDENYVKLTPESISAARYSLGGATVGNYAIFAGGYGEVGSGSGPFDRADYYTLE